MTEEEKVVIKQLVQAWDSFLQLTHDHLDETEEFRAGMHVLQNIVLARVGRRAFNESTP